MLVSTFQYHRNNELIVYLKELMQLNSTPNLYAIWMLIIPETKDETIDILLEAKSIRFVKKSAFDYVKELMIRTRPNTLIKSFKTGS